MGISIWNGIRPLYQHCYSKGNIFHYVAIYFYMSDYDTAMKGKHLNHIFKSRKITEITRKLRKKYMWSLFSKFKCYRYESCYIIMMLVIFQNNFIFRYAFLFHKIFIFFMYCKKADNVKVIMQYSSRYTGTSQLEISKYKGL
jgi:hypothetical protein